MRYEKIDEKELEKEITEQYRKVNNQYNVPVHHIQREKIKVLIKKVNELIEDKSENS